HTSAAACRLICQKPKPCAVRRRRILLEIAGHDDSPGGVNGQRSTGLREPEIHRGYAAGAETCVRRPVRIESENGEVIIATPFGATANHYLAIGVNHDRVALAADGRYHSSGSESGIKRTVGVVSREQQVVAVGAGN